MKEKIIDKYEEGVTSTYKSKDTEEWLDRYFNRQIGYLWALFFKKLHVSPNAVTIMSMVLGVAAGIMFYYTDLVHNIIGVLLLMWANFYDSADGQLARMTGKSTQWGRLLDGFAGDVWFFAIYLAIVLRLWNQPIPFTHSRWGILILIIAFFSGYVCHAKQCQLADYYRTIHMYFAFGKDGDNFDNSRDQRRKLRNIPRKGNFFFRLGLFFYGNYTHSQESMTPYFQDLMAIIVNERHGQIPPQFRLDFRKESKPMMKYANFLTFNMRAILLYICCIGNFPWVYFVCEIVVFSIVAYCLRNRHEKLCSHTAMLLKEGYYDDDAKLI
jgi:phosphatidylglycerophosphate synthase